MITWVEDLYYQFKDIDLLTRSIMAFLTSFFIMLIFGNKYIKFIKKTKNLLQPIRELGPQSHFIKSGTPTLGGVLIMMVFTISTLIFVKNLNIVILVILFASISFATIGLIDDILKLLFKNSKGLPARVRLILEFLVAIVCINYLLSVYPSEIAHSLLFPFVNSFFIPIGLLIWFVAPFILVGTANSVNLSDGLDGLASFISMGIFFIFFILLYIIITPNLYIKFSYTSMFYYNNIREIMVVIASMMGALCGFLWFNSHPAKVFMGDVGSLGVGATMGIIAIAIKQEIVLALVGLLLIVESVSVIIQVYYYKLTKRRFFLMAPIHHHYEKKGYKETTIVNRAFLITIALGMVALLLLDL